MLIDDEANSKLAKFLDKGIIGALFIFALGIWISKALTSIGLGFACLFWLIRIVITKNYKFLSSSINKPLIIFIIAIMFSGIDAWGTKFINETVPFIYLSLFYYAIVNTVKNLKIVKKLIYVTLFSSIVGVGYGLYEKFYLNLSRIKSFGSSLSFGELSGIFLLFAISYLLWAGVKTKKKIVLSVLAILFALTLLFTKTRGVWLAFVGGFSSLILLKDKKLIIVLIICLLIVPVVLPQNYVDRLKSSINITTNRSNLGRLALWKGSWLMFQDHPINGVGIGYFTDEYYANYKQPNTTNAKHAHNNFFHLLATTGVIGLLAFIWFLFSILKLLYSSTKEIDGNWGVFILASLGAVIIFSLEGLTQFNLGDAEIARFFWFLLSLNIVIINQFMLRSE
ncbi:MAG: O-antigen ligase family protein [Bacillota bacterium]